MRAHKIEEIIGWHKGGVLARTETKYLLYETPEPGNFTDDYTHRRAWLSHCLACYLEMPWKPIEISNAAAEIARHETKAKLNW